MNIYSYKLELFEYDINEFILMNRMKPNTIQHRDLPLEINFDSIDCFYFSYYWSKFLELTKGIQTILHVGFDFEDDLSFPLSWDFIRDLQVTYVKLLRLNSKVSFGSFLPFLKKEIIRDLDSKYEQIEIFIPQQTINGHQMLIESRKYSPYGRYFVQGKPIILFSC